MTTTENRLKYLHGYPAETLAQVQELITQGQLGQWLKNKYPNGHNVRTDKALFEYVQALKQSHLRGSEPLAKVAFDNKLQVVQHALGTHTNVSRVQGSKLKSKREIRIAALFKEAPGEFLKMIVVHELAHLKERAHDKAFHQLCRYMELKFYYHFKTVDHRTVDMARGRSEVLSTDQKTTRNLNQLTPSYSSHTTPVSYPKQNGCTFLL